MEDRRLLKAGIVVAAVFIYAVLLWSPSINTPGNEIYFTIFKIVFWTGIIVCGILDARKFKKQKDSEY